MAQARARGCSWLGCSARSDTAASSLRQAVAGVGSSVRPAS
jgi:hypothetical protein